MTTPNTYDTGLPTSQRSAIRAQVIAKLAPLLKSNGLYLRSIRPFARVLRGGHDEDGLSLLAKELNGQAPAILVALGKKGYEPAGSSMTDGRGLLEVAIYVASANPRDDVDGRLANDVTAAADNTADPGIETVLEHIEQLIDGQDLGIDSVYEMQAENEDEVWTGADFTIWEQVYRVKVDRSINVNRNISQLVLSIETQHALDTGNDDDPPTPAPIGSPANPIVDDITTLEAP